MPTIIVCSFLVLMIEIREKLKSQQRTKRGPSMQKIYTNMHMSQFFQPMLLNSKFLHKKTPRLALGNIPVPAQRRTF